MVEKNPVGHFVYTSGYNLACKDFSA